MRKYIKIILFISIIYSCSNDKYTDPSKLNISPYGVDIIIPKEIMKDSGVYFKIASKNIDFKIANAFFDCGKKAVRDYDTINHKLKNCEKNLLIENDTVKIYLEPFKVGKNKFEDLTILLIDKQGKLSFVDTTFYFEVLEIKK